MEIFKIIYTVLGGLGIFFYGMKIMSDSMQSIAGDMIRKIINSITSNRLLAVVIGTLITMIVQSSSVTTVMVIGMVNAGLMNLTQAIGVIFGANIGTTVTGWIISIKVGKYGLLLIGLGIFPTLFSKSHKWSQIGKLIFGVGMIFLGLTFMSGAFRPLRSMPEFLDAISYFSGHHYGAYIASMLTGCILTVIIQSSSAMLGITMALATSGVIGLDTALALVMGENIGTTITANLASIGGNVNAKRAARAHAIFNILGVILLMAIFPFYVNFIEWLVPGESSFQNGGGDCPYMAVHIATSHTIFNLTGVFAFIPFLNILARFVVRLIPDRDIKEQHHLVMLGNPSDIIPATALIQGVGEVQKLQHIVSRMFNLTNVCLKNFGEQSKNISKVRDYEQITDNIQKEITLFICNIMQREMTPRESGEAQGLVRITDELESIADYIEKLAAHNLMFEKEGRLKGKEREEFFKYLDDIYDYYINVTNLIGSIDDFDSSVISREDDEIKCIGDELVDRYVERVSTGDYSALTALSYSDMVSALKKIRGHVYNIAQAMNRMKKAQMI